MPSGVRRGHVGRRLVRAEYAAWLRENLVAVPFVALAVFAGLVVLMWATERLGLWLLARSERRRATEDS